MTSTRATGLTAEQFESEYAAASNVSVEVLRQWGLRVEQCDCGDECCRGWKMAPTLFLGPLPEALQRMDVTDESSQNL